MMFSHLGNLILFNELGLPLTFFFFSETGSHYKSLAGLQLVL